MSMVTKPKPALKPKPQPPSKPTTTSDVANTSGFTKPEPKPRSIAKVNHNENHNANELDSEDTVPQIPSYIPVIPNANDNNCQAKLQTGKAEGSSQEESKTNRRTENSTGIVKHEMPVSKGTKLVDSALVNCQLSANKKSNSKIRSDNVDAEGKYLVYDVREDEEQLVKFQEIIDLLVAAGYFRARIKGLANFDKIVGGMSWALEMSNVDLDVDLFFREDLTIGQKIALTEKIVKVLNKMKCPHQLEPHQIQGMDCIHIFPVIQWLIKKSIETRQQMGDYFKSFAVRQFNKAHNLLSDLEYMQKCQIASTTPQVDQIQKLAEEYLRKKVEIEENSLERKEFLLKKKVETAKKELEKARVMEEQLKKQMKSIEDQISNVRQEQEVLKTSVDEPEELSSDVLEKKRNLHQVHETLSKQMGEFKSFCREEKSRLEKEIEELANVTDTDDENDLEIELQTTRKKHQKLKLQLATLNQDVAKLQRRLDDIPSRAELTQYQKRFVELYNQVGAKHNETKKFYTLYNTLDDTRMYLEKELNLLNSIYDNFGEAQSSQSGREEFIVQFEQIVQWIAGAKLKIEKRKQTEKTKRDQLNKQYLDLVDKQREYYKAVKDFTEECRKNEILIGQYEQMKQQKKEES